MNLLQEILLRPLKGKTVQVSSSLLQVLQSFSTTPDTSILNWSFFHLTLFALSLFQNPSFLKTNFKILNILNVSVTARLLHQLCLQWIIKWGWQLLKNDRTFLFLLAILGLKNKRSRSNEWLTRDEFFFTASFARKSVTSNCKFTVEMLFMLYFQPVCTW